MLVSREEKVSLGVSFIISNKYVNNDDTEEWVSMSSNHMWIYAIATKADQD